MKRIKWLALLLVAVMALGMVLTGCGNNGTDEEQTVGDAEEQAQNETDQEDDSDTTEYDGSKVLDYYVSSEPQTLDAQQMWGQPDLFLANMFMEGLMRPGKKDGELVPGVAESYTFDEATNTYTFKLNPNAKWADGTSVTAEDFFFAWKLVMDEKGPYYQMMTNYIVGAEEYAAFTLNDYLSEKDPDFKALLEKLDELGADEEGNASAIKETNNKIDERIKNMTEEEKTEYQTKKDELWANVKAVAKDDGSTIEIALKSPVPYFPSLTAFAVYYPMNKDFYEQHKAAGDYCTEASGLNSNGPWKVADWKHDDYVKLVRNENYWNKDNIKIDELNIKIVDDIATRTNLLKTGELDGSAIQASDLPEFQDVATLEQYNLQELVNLPDFSVFYVEFNHFSNKITQNANIRKALAYAMDRTGFVEKINLGDEPALALIPGFFPGYEKTFREENGAELFPDNAKEEAIKYLEAGLKELGMGELPSLDMLIGDSDIDRKIGEKFQSDWAEIGITVNLVPLPWGERLSRLQKGDFAMSSSGWGPDYLDPMTYMELFESTNQNNSGRYNNPKYDELIQKARVESDAQKRMGYFYEAEKILVEDMVVAPEYFRIAHRAYKNYLTGVVNRGVGADTDFYFADIDMDAKIADQQK